MNKKNIELVTNPKWKAKRLVILERDGNKCTKCGSTSHLNVHHLVYDEGINLWDAEDKDLITLCQDCHKEWHKEHGSTVRNYTGGMTSNFGFEMDDGTDREVISTSMITASKAIVEQSMKSVDNTENHSMLDAVGVIVGELVDIIDFQKKGNIKITSKLTGDVIGSINIYVSFSKREYPDPKEEKRLIFSHFKKINGSFGCTKQLLKFLAEKHGCSIETHEAAFANLISERKIIQISKGIYKINRK